MAGISIIFICFLTAWNLLTSVCGNVEPDTGVSIKALPNIVIAVQKSPLTLDCSATSPPEYKPISYSWWKDGKRIVPDRRIQIKEDGSLYFRRVKRRKKKLKTDEGRYECYLTNKEGTVIGRILDLKIAQMAKKFKVEPQDQTAEEGRVAHFVCDIDGVPPPVYIWKKDGNQIPPKQKRYTNPTSGVLQIHNLESSDAGHYHCTVHQVSKLLSSSNVSLRNSRDAKLTVIKASGKKVAPTIVASSSEVRATVEEPVTLECLADGNPKPTITWLKVDTSSKTDKPSVTPVLEDVHKKRIGDGNLKFNEVSTVDKGIYKCVASSPGFSDVEAEVKLIVNVPPKIKKSPVSSVQPIAQRIRLPCVIEGDPEPEVKWYHNGKEIQTGGNLQISRGELLIESTVSDSGYFQCIAQNSIGSVIATSRLKITLEENAPTPPQQLTAMPLSPSRIKVSWLSSDFADCCPVIAYTVHYSEVIGKSIVQVEQRTVTAGNTVIVKKLKPYTQYRFYVRAYSAAGASKDSYSVTARTEESMPTTAPTFNLSSPSPESINIEWDPLPEEERNGIITGYKIMYKTPDSQHIHTQEVASDITHLAILGLRPGTEYFVRVLAKTSKGYPDLPEEVCPWVSQITSSNYDTIVLPTPTLSIKAINESVAQVDWEVQDTTALIKGYQLYVRNLIGKSDTKVYQIPKTSNSFNLTGLEARMYYDVVLMVEGKGKTLGIVNKSFQAVEPNTTPQPPPPTEISVTITTPSKIFLVWNKPRTGIDIHHYTVRYHKSRDPHNVTYKRSDNRSVILDDLDAFTAYSISVRSDTRETTGVFSNPIEATTKEDVPSAPENVYLIPIEKGVVELKWKPPLHQNGIIIYYIIQYNNNKSDPDFQWHKTQRNGTVTTAIVRDLKSTIYYFKLRACTRAGEGPPSNIIEVELNKCAYECYNPIGSQAGDTGSTDSILKDQRLGIIIGCTIGITCILVCILVIIIRQRHYANLYQRSTAIQLDNQRQHDDNMQTYVGEQLPENDPRHPMLQENRNFDAKGPGPNVIVHRNGKIIYLCSERFYRGRGGPGSQSPEQTCLIWSHDHGTLESPNRPAENGDDDGNQSLSLDSGTSMAEGGHDTSPCQSEENSETDHKFRDRAHSVELAKSSNQTLRDNSAICAEHSASAESLKSVGDSFGRDGHQCNAEGIGDIPDNSCVNACNGEVPSGKDDYRPCINSNHGHSCHGEELLSKMLQATTSDIDCNEAVVPLMKTSRSSPQGQGREKDNYGLRSGQSRLPPGQGAES